MMAYDMAVDGLRLLSEVDIAMAAGGYEPNLPGEGGGGPTAAEARIESIYLDYDSPSLGGDEWFSYHEDGAMFYDSDHNGYYDHYEISGDGGVWIYDGATDSWTFKAYDENQGG
jgi:hypothetical protein